MVEAVEVVAERARTAVAAARRAHHELLVAVAELDRELVAAQTGYRSTPRVVQELFRVDRAEASRLVDQAADLCSRVTLDGRPLPPRLPASADAARAGRIGEGHVRVLQRTMTRLAKIEGIDPGAEADAERLLAGWAAQLSPAGLAKAAEHLLETLDPDGVAPDEDEGADDELQVGRRSDGSLALKGRFRDRVDIELVLEVLDALSAPAGPDDHRDLARRRAEAFTELCAQALSSTGIAADTRDHGAEDGAPTASPIPEPRGGGHDERPAAQGCPPVTGRGLLMITIDHRWLTSLMGHAVLDSETPIHPATARRWACDAGVVPAVLGSQSQPLDVGRLWYTVSEAQRRALHHRDGGCAFPGCTRRPKRCHAHHVVHWADGGPTDLDNLTLLCRHHHTVVHHDQWRIAMIRGRPWFTPPAWVDPERSPRPGGRALAPTG